MRIALVLLLCLGLVGCATGHDKRRFTGHLSESKIQEDIFRVTVMGNIVFGGDWMENSMLFRCAEITLENGYKYFVIIEDRAYPQSTTTSYTSIEQPYVFSKLSPDYNTIKCFKVWTDLPTTVYDAEQISKSIKEKYRIKE